MATIKKQKIRAIISIAGIGDITTPNVVSFTVNRARTQMSANFNASVKILYSDLRTVTDAVVTIRAGLEGEEKPIFTGLIERSTINPIRTDVSKVMLNISGRDKLSILEGQNIDRRLKTWKDGVNPPERWGVVTGIVKPASTAREKFRDRIIDYEPKAATDIVTVPLEVTPDAFKGIHPLGQQEEPKASSALEITKVNTTED